MTLYPLQILRVSPWEVKLRERVLGLMGKKGRKLPLSSFYSPLLPTLLPFPLKRKPNREKRFEI
ncbi:MAG: hypothetical protein C6I01_01755 [Epsilonproteobacteria bacterium]|nr:hypothetical protein [Campylobacterota bacterium]